MKTVERTYSSPLREEQAQATERRIVEAAKLLIVGGVETVTMPEVAKAAGVGLRTVFRYFPTRDALLDATWNALNAQMGEIPDLMTLADLTGFIPDLYGRYGAMEDQIRAVMLSKILLASRVRQSSPRRRKMLAAVDALVGADDDRQARMARAAAYLFTIPTAMLFLKDNHDLTTEEAAQAAAWAVETLVKAARTHPPKAARKAKP